MSNQRKHEDKTPNPVHATSWARQGGPILAQLPTLLALVAALAGCAPEKPVVMPPSATAVRPQLGKVAATPTGCQATYAVPPVASGAGGGAKAAAGQGAILGARPGALMVVRGGPSIAALAGIPVALGGALVGATVGAVTGSIRAHPTEEVDAAEATARQVILSVPADETLVDLVVAKAESAGLSDRIERAPKGPAASELVAHGCGSALLIEVPLMMLRGEGQIEPDADVWACASGRIATLPNADVLWSRAWFYRSPPESFFALVANDGQPLRETIDTALAAIAAQIVDDVLVGADAHAYADWRQAAPGTVHALESCDTIKRAVVPTPTS